MGVTEIIILKYPCITGVLVFSSHLGGANCPIPPIRDTKLKNDKARMTTSDGINAPDQN